MAGVGFAVAVVGAFGLRPGAKTAVRHHDQWRNVTQLRWAVQMKGSADPADIDGVAGILLFDAGNGPLSSDPGPPLLLQTN